MSEIKPKQLTAKQEKFCREYLLTGNASEAYRRAFDCEKSQPETVWKRASELLAKGGVKGRIEALKNDLEELLGITKATEIKQLQKIRNQCLTPEPVLEWDPLTKRMIQKVNEKGEPIWMFDSAGANSAQDKIFKAMGYYAPNSIVTQDKEGNIMPLSSINITIKDNTDES
jgi:phage terminase small subunit